MGRRALRKIDPSLDLSRHFKSLDDLPNLVTAQALFGNDAALEVEVGSGKGLFLAAAAAAHPERNFLGIEVSRKYARFAAAKLVRAGCANALMIHGDGLRLFREMLPGASLDAVHVYFPDPWWKKRHKKRRVMNEDFVGDVQRTLRDGGRLHFWTDVQEYFLTTLELIASATQLQGPLEVPQREAEHDMDYRTHFERRTRQHDQPVHRAEFRKNSR